MTRPNVPFVALERQHVDLQEELLVAFQRVVGASGFILGGEVAAFEDEFARFCGTKHCVGVSSGTSALTLAMMAAGVAPGDEVIVPAFTFIASALAVLHAGATPVLCDVEAGTGLIDAEAAASAVGPRTAGILAVHLYGQVCDMRPLARLAKKESLVLFEDAAQAHGASHRGGRAGSLGLAGAFSFYPSKNLGALGDGGAICTNDQGLANRARELRHLGQRKKGEYVVVGYNERLDGLQAALLRVKLPHLDGWNETRRARAGAYRDGLEGTVGLLEELAEGYCIYHLFPVRLADRDRIAALLADSGVQTGVHYTPSLQGQPALEGRVGGSGFFPAASAWAAEELSLPMFESLSAPEVARVVEVLGRLCP